MIGYYVHHHGAGHATRACSIAAALVALAPAAQADQITYFYTSRLPGEAADGVADRHFHPVEPTAVRLTLAGRF